MAGAVFESWCFAEILKSYYHPGQSRPAFFYYRDRDQKEIDLMIEEAGDFSDADMLLLPGGMPGSTNLRDHQGVIAALQRQAQAGKRVGAICAAPLVLAHAGLLHGRRATIYPGMAAHLGDAIYEEKLVVEDGLITTAEGPAAVLPYSYRLVSYFRGDEAAQSIAKGMVYDRLLREG